jgi:hypothetical protein
MAYLVGNDGGVSLGTNQVAQFNVWNATFSRQVSDITGFGDGGRRRQLGVHDCTGSAGGFLMADAANTKPSLGKTAATATSAIGWLDNGATIYLHARGSGTATASTACTWNMSAVISDAAVSVTKTGDAAISFNFQLAGGAIPVETWDETV